MILRKAVLDDIDSITPLIAKFRVELRELKNIPTGENLESASEEFMEYINNGYPIFIYKDENICLGYLVCRVDKPTVWVESLYVLNSHRRMGIASALFDEAERLAKSYGEDTLYNFAHPNNDAIIAFLNKKGYSVLNLIEIRKKYADEKTDRKIIVGNNKFDY